MDELDRRIISLLQMDGRASNAKIAREVGVSEGTVRRRLRRLIQEDVVKVVAVPNLEKLGYATTALIGLQTGPGKSDTVAESIAGLDEAHYVAHHHWSLRRLHLGRVGICRKLGHLPTDQNRRNRRGTTNRDLRKPGHKEAHLRPGPVVPSHLVAVRQKQLVASTA